MAPKEPFKVHSLSKHIENTKKGLSADAQFNRRPGNRAAAVKKESNDPNHIFADNDDDDNDDSGSGSESDSSSDNSPANFITKLTGVKKPASAVSRRRSKDDEIADSDDERNASKKSKSVKKPVPAKAKPASSSESSSESESDDGKTKAKTNGTTVAKSSDTSSSSSESESESESDEEAVKVPATKAPTEKQEESDSSSDSSDESEHETKAKPAANGTAAASDTSSEGSESESEDEEQTVKPAEKPTAKTAAKPVAKTTAKSNVKSAATVQDSSSSEDEDSDDEMVDESMHIEDRQGSGAIANFIAPDFVLRKGDDGTKGQDVAQICNQANLEGKQFWYFTVPSNVPISVVQNLEIPMNQSRSSDKLFSHDGDDYGISFESIAPKGNIQIVIPSSDGSQYRQTPKQIDQVMQVKKITQLGANSSVGPVPKPAPRAQPAGLKARYQPIGVNEPMNNDDDQDDVEMAEAPVLSAKTSKKDKKRKTKETSDKKQKKGQSVPEPTEETVTPDTRKNKRKLTASEEDAAAVVEQLQQEAKAANRAKKQKTDRVGSPDLGSEPASTNAKKQTPVLPPTLPSAGTPLASRTKQKKVKETPVPAPRQSVVPIPAIPHSSPLKPSSTPAPSSQPPASPSQTKEKRVRKKKEKKETHVPPPQYFSSSE
ncbi:hypothetical protein FHETE_8799 [Fusarium heterosporum]|uniref:Uncharacterized protein n=1 Tax=Fusarium heterosporum TaxID=42747 RepID=A0A8H5WJX9_FUSHE|nr:hypothetical protein FHETE_8799 [Fusarium heterosporum]